jgi:hypothetical protein
MACVSVAETRGASSETAEICDLAYTSAEEEEEDDDVRLEGFVVSDSEVEYLTDEPDDMSIVKQLPTVQNLGTTFAEGRRVSTRARKPTERYVHPDAAEVNAAFATETAGTETDSDMSVGSAWDGYDPGDSDDSASDSEDDT